MSKRVSDSKVIISNLEITITTVSMLIGTLLSIYGIQLTIDTFQRDHQNLVRSKKTTRNMEMNMRKNLTKFNNELQSLVDTSSQYRELFVEFEALYPYVYERKSAHLLLQAMHEVFASHLIQIRNLKWSPTELNFSIITQDEEKTLGLFNDFKRNNQELALYIDQVSYLDNSNNQRYSISGRVYNKSNERD